MDTDVEMVHPSSTRGRDDLAPAEQLREMSIVDHPSVRRQNIMFLVALFSCVLVFGVFVLGKIYTGSSPVGKDFGGFDGKFQNDKLNKVSSASGKYSNSHGKGWSKNHNTQNSQEDDTTNDDGINPKNICQNVDAKVQKWLDAEVTLADGIQYEILSQLSHDNHAFTEGLCFVNGRLFESVGLTGKSDLRELDPETGKTLASYPIAKVFGEGLTYAHGRLIQLTYKSRKGFIYDLNYLDKEPEVFMYNTTTNEGWGFTYDPCQDELIVSDGSQYLHFWDPLTLEFKRKTNVTRMNGKDAYQINELEYWRGKVLANIWYQDIIIVIDPASGRVEKEYDFTKLWDESKRKSQGADVLNGISVSADPDVLYITGKLWDRMFRIKLLP